MILRSLFDPSGVLVLLAVIAMVTAALVWLRKGQKALDQLTGALSILRRIAGELHGDHPIRRRLESAPIVDLSFEEITRLMTGARGEAAARSLIRLAERVAWIERFGQFAVHLGILGTVFALVSSDPNDLKGFRASLPMALGTTFWGLIGALGLSAIAGTCETLLERARQYVRHALLEGLEPPPTSESSPASDRVES